MTPDLLPSYPKYDEIGRDGAHSVQWCTAPLVNSGHPKRRMVRPWTDNAEVNC